ncbi:hypothetical protein DYQ86_11855 [Acidobacteria bacterium AB60]|nr:hypothetical protein DYQ86_11855 [Acidobacteria bacterium AB60]
MRTLKRALSVLLVVTASLPLSALDSEPAVSFGHKETIESRITGEKRQVLVYMPDVPQGTKVPVLVVLDGEYLFPTATTLVRNLTGAGRLPAMAVVGVTNTNRGRDMNPGFQGEEFASDDAAARFIAYLCDEMLPFLEQKYPLSNYRALAGLSNGGLFLMYAFAQRPNAFQAHIIMSPASGDDRILPLFARSLARPGLGTHFLFLSNGDEEADIVLGATRLAKTIEDTRPPSLTYHYEYLPGETHASVATKSLYRALELLGQPDPVWPAGPAMYLTEMQRRDRAWTRLFGSYYAAPSLAGPGPKGPPPVPIARPLLDCLAASGRDGLAPFWSSVRNEYAPYFRLDPLDLKNLAAYLESQARKEDAAALRSLPAFPSPSKDDALNNYGSAIDLERGLAARIVMDGNPRDLANAASQFKIQGALPTTGRDGKENGAYRFDGKSNISVTGNPALQSAGSLTVSAWIRPRVPTAYAAWISQVRSAGWGSKWRVGFGASPNSQWGPTILATRWFDYWKNGDELPVGKWVHTVAVFDQTLATLKLYRDGKIAKEFYGIPAWESSTGPLLIGLQRDDGISYIGDVGEVRIYNRTLSAQEVTALYSAR